jgi:hypothetical protein
MRISDVLFEKEKKIMPFLAYEKRGVTQEPLLVD